MKQTKMISLALAAMLFAGCAAPVQAEPEPTPPPVRMAVVSAADGFAEMLAEQAGNEVEINAADNIEDADFDIALLYMPDADEVEEITGSGVVLTDEPELIPEDISTVTVDDDAAVRAAWDALYNYPSHSTPIRLLTLTAGGEGLSREMFDTMLAEGKLQDKGNYIESQSEQPPEEWVAQRLEAIPVGLLDTIYADTEELAIAAYNALRAAERNDSVEVICPVLTEKLIGLMVEDHWSMGVCVGVSMKQGAEAMLELAEELINGGKPGSRSLEPVVVYSDEVKALVDSGVSDISEIMDAVLDRF